MKPRNILLPLDIAMCPLEVFPLVNGFGRDLNVTVTLLHVVTLNLLMPRSGLIDDLCREAEHHLEGLEKKFFNRRLDTRMCIRIGKLVVEILAEAEKIHADWIILTSFAEPAWKRALHRILPGVVGRVIRHTPCDVSLFRVRTRFDCTRDWSWASSIPDNFAEHRLPPAELVDALKTIRQRLLWSGCAP